MKATKLAHTKAGRKGPTLVLLHGLGGSREDWDEAIPHLEKSFRLVAYDLPGCGDSPKPATGYDSPRLAKAVLAAFEHDGVAVESCHLAGHSLGAAVAAEIALHRKEEGRAALVLVAPLAVTSYSFVEKLKWKAMSRASVILGSPETSMKNAAAFGFAHHGAARKAYVARTLAARKGPEAHAVAKAVEHAVDAILDGKPLADRLRRTTFQLGVVWGTKDPLADAAGAAAIQEARPDAQVVTILGAGHYPYLEDPKAFAAALRKVTGA